MGSVVAWFGTWAGQLVRGGLFLGFIMVVSPFLATAQTAPSAPQPLNQVALRAYRGLVEEHLAGVLRAVRIVATSAEARAGRWEDIEPLLERLSSDLPTDATAWFARPDGSYFATAAGGMTEQNLRDREYFPSVMAGTEVVGVLVVSKSTGHRSVVIAAPIAGNRGVVGAIGVSLRVRLLSARVAEYLPLPEDAYFYALDRDTRIVIHQKAERMFKTPSDIGDESLGRAFEQVIKKDAGTFEYVLNGQPMRSIFERSPTLGWYFFMAQAAASQ